MKRPFPDDLFVLADTVLDVAREHPDRVAVVAPDGRDASGARRYRRYTYRALSRDAESVAPGLRAIGVAEGTRTVFLAPPSYEACVVGLALTRVGATQVWIDPSVGLRNVGERLRRIEPEAFVGIPLAHLGRMAFGWGPRLSRRAIAVDGRFPGAHTIASLARTPPETPSAPDVRPADPAAIFYTTGSTGPAKPTLYLHENLSAMYRLAHRVFGFEPEREAPIDMSVFPAFFFIPLSAGGTMVVPPIDFVRESPAEANPQALLEVIRDTGVRSLFGSPVLLQNLGRHAVARGLTTPSLRRVVGGGAPIDASMTAALQQMMGKGGEVLADYGATEALPATEMSGREALRETFARTSLGEGMCVGRPLYGVEVKVIRIADGPIASFDAAEELAPREIGEIVVRAPHVSPAYFGDAANTAKHKIAAPAGFFHRVGDAGYLDDEGRLWYLGRVGQRVKLAGGSLFSLQCEPIFDAHPDVRRTGLVGVPGVGGEIPVICVEVRRERGVDLGRLRDELLARAAEHATTACIRHVLFHPRLPVDPRHNSKIERPALAKWAAERISATERAPRAPELADLKVASC